MRVLLPYTNICTHTGISVYVQEAPGVEKAVINTILSVIIISIFEHLAEWSQLVLRSVHLLYQSISVLVSIKFIACIRFKKKFKVSTVDKIRISTISLISKFIGKKKIVLKDSEWILFKNLEYPQKVCYERWQKARSWK